eukprot:TRINITY_DN524_c0_g2_i1.p1 TRINITY_DN524_c0_g2~~TRINITY_DN524_c0_g2_i1.p1  ORF type:complete len:1653 (+),score=358.45 TRINITY_DN524_c0_g2_i1:271-4959(+)
MDRRASEDGPPRKSSRATRTRGTLIFASPPVLGGSRASTASTDSSPPRVLSPTNSDGSKDRVQDGASRTSKDSLGSPSGAGLLNLGRPALAPSIFDPKEAVPTSAPGTGANGTVNILSPPLATISAVPGGIRAGDRPLLDGKESTDAVQRAGSFGGYARRRASIISRPPVQLYPRHSNADTDPDAAAQAAQRHQSVSCRDGEGAFVTWSQGNPLQAPHRRLSNTSPSSTVTRRRVSVFQSLGGSLDGSADLGDEPLPPRVLPSASAASAQRSYEAQHSRRRSSGSVQLQRAESGRSGHRPTVISLTEDAAIPLELGLDINIPTAPVEHKAGSGLLRATSLRRREQRQSGPKDDVETAPDRRGGSPVPLGTHDAFGSHTILEGDDAPSPPLAGLRKSSFRKGESFRASWSQKRKSVMTIDASAPMRQNSATSGGFAVALGTSNSLLRHDSSHLRRLGSNLLGPQSRLPSFSSVASNESPLSPGSPRKDDVIGQPATPGLVGKVHVQEATPELNGLTASEVQRSASDSPTALTKDTSGGNYLCPRATSAIRKRGSTVASVGFKDVEDAPSPRDKDGLIARLSVVTDADVNSEGDGSEPSPMKIGQRNRNRTGSHASYGSFSARRASVASSTVSERQYDRFKTTLSVMDLRSRTSDVDCDDSFGLDNEMRRPSLVGSDVTLSPWGAHHHSSGPRSAYATGGTDKALATPVQSDLDAQQAWMYKWDRYWTPILFLYVIYQLLVVPLRCGLDFPATRPVAYMDMAVDLIFWIEIACRFRRPHHGFGFVITPMKERATAYLKKNFLWDLAIALPLDLIGVILAESGEHEPSESHFRSGVEMYISPWWRLNKILLFRYGNMLFTHVFSGLIQRAPLYGRVGGVFCLFFLCTHYVTCLFLAVLLHEGKDAQMSLVERENFVDGIDTLSYLHALDYSLKSVVGMSRPGRSMPQTDLQCAWCIVAAISGFCLYAVVLSAVGNLFREVISEEDKWREKHDEMWDTFRYLTENLHLDRSFCDELYAYFHHEFWVSRVLLGRPHEVLTGLPPLIGDRINTHVGGVTLSRVPMFRNVASDNIDFMNFLLMRMEPNTFCKGEQIMTKGECGDTMYFLMYGEMGIYDEAADRIVFVCPQGTTLGEIALLHDCRRTATVIALEYCSCFTLSKETFLEAEMFFPQVIARVREEVEEKLTRLKLAEIMDRLPVLAQFTENDLFCSEILDNFEPRAFPAGAAVYFKGDAAHDFYFLSQGEVSVDGQLYGSGSLIGASDVIFTERRTQTMRAVTSLSMFAVPDHLLERIDELFPALFEFVYNAALDDYTNWIRTSLFSKVPADLFEPLDVDFYDRLAMVLITKVVSQDTDFVARGDPVPGAFFVNHGRFVEDYGEGECSYLIDETDSFGSIAYFKPGVLAETRVVAQGECVVYMLSVDDFDLLREQSPECDLIFLHLAKEEMKTVLFRKLFSVSEVGTMKRYLLKLLNFTHERRVAAVQQRMKMQASATNFAASSPRAGARERRSLASEDSPRIGPRRLRSLDKLNLDEGSGGGSSKSQPRSELTLSPSVPSPIGSPVTKPDP